MEIGHQKHIGMKYSIERQKLLEIVQQYRPEYGWMISGSLNKAVIASLQTARGFYVIHLKKTNLQAIIQGGVRRN